MCYFCYSNQQKQLVLCSSDCSLFQHIVQIFFFSSSVKLQATTSPLPTQINPQNTSHTTLNITYICHERKRETASSSWWLGRAHRPDYTEGEPKSFSRYSPPHQFLHSLSTLLSQKYSCLIVFFVVFIFFPSTPGEWKQPLTESEVEKLNNQTVLTIWYLSKACDCQ